MTSPAHRQYLALKQRYPDAVLLFRLGDFYEMFDDDARLGAEVLGITLTSREFGKGDRVPMAGVPHHALAGHLRRFVRQGIKVAICEQLSEPGRGLVERDVVRVVTPGTVDDESMLEAGENNFLAAVNVVRGAAGLAYVDVTTGEFRLTQLEGEQVESLLDAEILRLHPSEILVPRDEDARAAWGNVTVFDDFRFDPDTARETLRRQFRVRSLEGFGCEDMPAAVGAAGAIVAYVERMNRAQLCLLTGLQTYHINGFMTLDRYTRRNLELSESARTGQARASLLALLDQTHTAMGARLLRQMLGQPLLDVDALEARLDVITDLVDLPAVRSHIRQCLHHFADIERLNGRIGQGIATPRDLLSLRASLVRLPEILAALRGASSPRLQARAENIDLCADVTDLIERAVDGSHESHPLRPGYSPELDELVEGIRDAREWIARLEGVERDRSGIRSLKVGYNRVFGYYIEVSHANRGLVPDEYVRKQTLVNAERFITPELKEYEERILRAEDRIASLERTLFADLLRVIAAEGARLSRTAAAVAAIDVTGALAHVAAQYGYCRPTLDRSDRIDITDGRHPVVERALDDAGFIPNDVHLGCDDRQVLVITGPNMGGKSTYLRQVALIVLMAQIGSFVPAASAHVGLVDRIFSRVGAQDDIASGQSTFMVEMVETANIVNHATHKSLLVLDEVGRGTSTYDGLAIARALLQYIHDRIGARTLFATHYHELTQVADRLPRTHNVNVAVAEDGDDVVFLHRVVPGGADRSYGIHVATLAGLPREITDAAREVLAELEMRAGKPGSGRRSRAQQISLFDGPANSLAAQILDDLLALDVTAMTPLEAIMRLYELQSKGRGG